MTTEQTVLNALKQLPPDKQQEVLDFVKSLRAKCTVPRPLRSVEGLWADLHADITEEDIAEARSEMWGNFPREEFYK